MKRITPIIIALSVATNVFAESTTTTDMPNSCPICRSVTQFMEEYPEAALTDIYKSCFQDRFGPGHLAPSREKAENYLDWELNTFDEYHPKAYEPTLYEGHFVRVNLRLLKDGTIPRDKFIDTFMESTNKVEPMAISEWVDEWNHILSCIRTLNIPIADFDTDRLLIDWNLRQGNVVRDHSFHYEEIYHPHYRLIEAGLFKERLLPYIEQNACR